MVGWLIIMKTVLLMNQNVVHEAKKTLTKYVYDNSQVIGKIDEIFNKD